MDRNNAVEPTTACVIGFFEDLGVPGAPLNLAERAYAHLDDVTRGPMKKIEMTVLRELRRIDAEDTVEGQAALALARAIGTGAALMGQPAMVKELRATMTELRDKTPVAKDAIDEIAAARAARRAG